MRERFFQVSRSAAALAVAACFSTVAIAGEEKVIAIDSVPADIVAVAKNHLSGLRLSVDGAPQEIDSQIEIDDNLEQAYEELGKVSLTGANTETETDGSFVYEIQGVLEDGRKVEIDIEPNGAVEEIELEFHYDDVPGAIQAALAAKMPKFKPDFIEASHSASMQVVGYEFVGQMGEETIDLEVSADGRSITVADQ